MPTPTHEPDALKLQRLTPREMAPVAASPTEQSKVDDKKQNLKPPPPLVLRVALRPGRVTILTLFCVCSIVSVVLYFHEGHELQRFDKHSKTTQEQNRLLDLYNSYAGNFATLFSKPLEMFVMGAVQVLMLRFLTSFLLRPTPDLRVNMVAFVLSTGVGYLVGNAFNALNVQLRDVDVRPVIRSNDLSADSEYAAIANAGKTSNVLHSIPENTPMNDVTNTILRNLVIPREAKAPTRCDWFHTQRDFSAYIPDDVLEFGMPQRDWMKKMLPEALDSHKLKVIINPTLKDANKNVRAADLPMNASTAANLYLYTLFLSNQYIPLGKTRTWSEKKLSDFFSHRNVSTARLAGILPWDTKANEAARKEWFLKTSGPELARRFANGSVNASMSDIVMEFSHTQLSPSISFDAMSLEVTMRPELLTDFVDETDKTRYLVIPSKNCMPYPARCQIRKRDQPPIKNRMSLSQYDSPMLIHAYAIGLDENGTEAIRSLTETEYPIADLGVQGWDSRSNDSMLLVSVAKRLEADRLIQNSTANASGLYPQSDSVVVTNVRKIYTFTVARLGWKLQNLSADFGAACAKKRGNCLGLSFPLYGTNGSITQHLVVSEASLPTRLLSFPFMLEDVRQRSVSLVQVTEPPRDPIGREYDDIAGDFLLPHNIKKINWTIDRLPSGRDCNAFLEDRQQLVLNNHIYMETTLQATYTAAMFFLFQDGVAKDVVKLRTLKTTLAFEGNVHEVALWLSIPRENTVLTLAGCAGLFGALFVTLIWSLYNRFAKVDDPLARITNPHVIARAMLDESQFPSLLLHRRVMDTSDGFQQRTVAAFVIDSLTIQHQRDNERRAAAVA